MYSRSIISILITTCVYLLASGGVKAQVADSLTTIQDSLIQAPDSLFLTIDSARTTHASHESLDGESTFVSQRGISISGVVIDKNTQEGIPYATIFFPGTPTGTAAGLDGSFELIVTELPSDTLRVQAVGYDGAGRLLFRNNNNYSFRIELERTDNTLDEFVFRAGEDPAVALVK